jgi:hypothetical protein
MVAIAMMATAGGIFARIIAVFRMLAILTEMKLVPHSHFFMSGGIQGLLMFHHVIPVAT